MFLKFIKQHEYNSQFMEVLRSLLARVYAEEPSDEDIALKKFWLAFLTEEEEDDFQDIWYCCVTIPDDDL